MAQLDRSSENLESERNSARRWGCSRVEPPYRSTACTNTTFHQ